MKVGDIVICHNSNYNNINIGLKLNNQYSINEIGVEANLNDPRRYITVKIEVGKFVSIKFYLEESVYENDISPLFDDHFYHLKTNRKLKLKQLNNGTI